MNTSYQILHISAPLLSLLKNSQVPRSATHLTGSLNDFNKLFVSYDGYIVVAYRDNIYNLMYFFSGYIDQQTCPYVFSSDEFRWFVAFHSYVSK